MADVLTFPRQNLPFNKKNKEWRENCVKWAKSFGSSNSSTVRKSVRGMRINYDLLNGKLSMSDMVKVLNPHGIEASYIPKSVIHYPIMNPKLNVLRGEESRRLFDYRVVVTNPNAISEVEENKKNEVLQKLTMMIQLTSQSEEEMQKELEKLSEFYMYSWQDLREIKGNYLLNHFVREYDLPLLFNKGFMDAMTVGEEIYRCEIVSGEPIIEKLDPTKVRIFRSSNSSNIEDADIIVIEDYWSPGRIIDHFHNDLTQEQINKIESFNLDDSDEYIGENPATRMAPVYWTDESEANDVYLDLPDEMGKAISEYSKFSPIDTSGNIRVLQVYWKSRRKVKKVKSYDPQTGETIEDLYPETYKINESLGEEETILWINEAWQGNCIGEDIYLNIKPRDIQYNRLSNPSRCHFGIIGSIYNLNGSQPFSLVDAMKPYSYLYNAIHDRLNKAIADNWGTIITMDLAKIPKKWNVEQWMHFAKVNKIAVVDSFKEGNSGAAMGKIAGGLNNANSGVIQADIGNSIQGMLGLLEFIKNEMSEAAGISRQREGQISNRETVGGVERSNLQSAHITEWLFSIHDNLKKRVLECFLETCKIAHKGGSIKIQNLLPNSARHIMTIDGDEFAEADYGLLVDNGQGMQELQAKLESLALASLQNQAISLSTIMKIYSSTSIAEKQRMIEKDEQDIIARNQQNAQEQLKAQQEQLQAQLAQHERELQLKDQINQRDNETKLAIAELQATAGFQQTIFRLDDDQYSEEEKLELQRKNKEHEDKMKLERDKLKLQQEKIKEENQIKREALKRTKTNN